MGKVIDLLNESAKGKNLKFRKDGGEYKDSLWTFIRMYSDEKMSFEEIVEWLNSEVEILEDTEEIDIQSIEEIECPMNGNAQIIDDRTWTLNQVIKAVKQLDNKIKEE